MGYPGAKKEHRLPGMVIQPGRRCAAKGCSRPAIYGTDKPNNCYEHHQDGERNLVHERCISCGLPDLLDLKTSLCGDCAPETRQRAYLVKQRAVKAMLDLGPHKDYDGYDEVVDKGICGKERPDFWWDCGTHHVVLEVDENQHGGRPEACECARMVNISQTFGSPTHFIRFNPDEYRADQGKTRTKGESHARRMALLEKHLEAMKITRETGGSFCSASRLYYDGWKPSQAGEIETILDAEA